MTTTVRFTRRGDTYAITLATYNPDVVAVIKTIQSFLRSWNTIRREWSIFEPVYARQLAEDIAALGHTVIGMYQPNRHTVVPIRPAGAWAVFQRVGPQRAPIAYRLLSKLCHPDHFRCPTCQQSWKQRTRNERTTNA